jgi:hypothetical protein
MTAFVGVGLLGMAAVVAIRLSGWNVISALPHISRTGAWVLVVLFALRAVGDFRYVGFFKRVRGTPFGRRDTIAYSPLCAILALLIAVSDALIQ